MERSVKIVNGKAFVLCRVKSIIGIYDFTLAADPAYPDTSCEARELTADLLESQEPDKNTMREQVREMRSAATHKPEI